MENSKLTYSILGDDYDIKLLDYGYKDPLNHFYYLYFEFVCNNVLSQEPIIIGISDLVMSQWGLSEENSNEIIYFCWQIIPAILKIDFENTGKKLVIFHRDDNVVKKDDAVYIKAESNMHDSAKRLVFGSIHPSNTQIRREILRVCYTKWLIQPHMFTLKNELTVMIPSTGTEIERNLQYLVEKGYLKGTLTMAGYAHVTITDRGIDICEDPEEFNRLFSLKVEQTVNTVNVSGDYVSQSIKGNNNNALINSSVIDSFRSIEKEVESSNDPNKAVLLKTISELKEELNKKKPKSSIVKSLMGKLKESASWVNDKILSHPILSQLIATVILNQANSPN